MAGTLPTPFSTRSAGEAEAPTLVARSGRRKPREWPKRVGAYELMRFLSAGGMGLVFEARKRFADQRVALKFMDPDAHYPHKDERFSREIRALRMLRHENTTRFIDFGRTHDGLRFLVMEYVPGITLGELVARAGALPTPRALSLLRQLCAAIAEVHAAGLAHRDLKPSNVMVMSRARRADWIKVIDFGLVRMPEANGSMDTTMPGLFLGTPGYAPPEAWSRAAPIDARGDVYGIGLIAHHLLTGCPPPEPVETLAHHSRRIIADLERYVPPRLITPIARCLSNDPMARCADAGELLRELPAP